MGNPVIVCGLGHVGYRLALLLRRLGADVTAIYENTPADWIRNATRLGIDCLAGDARDDALLERAGIRAARAIVAATDHDMTNLAVALDARRLNPGIVTVVRLFDTSLAQPIEAALGLRKVLSTSSLAAPVFASAALGRNVAGCFTIAGRSFTLSELAVPADSPWLGQSWETVAGREEFHPLFLLNEVATVAALAPGLPVEAGQRVMLLRKAATPSVGQQTAPASRGLPARLAGAGRALGRAWRELPPAVKGVTAALALIVAGGTFTFHHFLGLSPVDAFYFVITTISTTGYGDYNLQGSPAWLKLFGCFVMLCGAALMATIFSVVTDRLLKLRFRRLMETPEEALGPHAILVGRNNVGQRIADELRRAGLPVVILTPASGEHAEAPPADTQAVIVADPRSDAALTRAGIASATAVLAVTEDDVMNLGVALQARRLNSAARSVIRTFDADLGAKLQSHLGGAAVISVSAVSAPTFAATALCRDVVQATVWHDHLIVVQFSEKGPCPAPDQPAPTLSFPVPSAAADLGRASSPSASSATTPELRVSVFRLG